MKVVWNGKAVVEMLRDFGLSGYEARIYFVLLTLGEGKVTELTKRAYVPQSKGYEVLDKLIDKGFAERMDGEKPKKYRATTLHKVASKIMAKEQKFIRKLNSDFESLQDILSAVSPIYEEYGMFRLFSPTFPRREEAWRPVDSQV
jgi:sugar-specific transcriptional regulator TrmB